MIERRLVGAWRACCKLWHLVDQAARHRFGPGTRCAERAASHSYQSMQAKLLKSRTDRDFASDRFQPDQISDRGRTRLDANTACPYETLHAILLAAIACQTMQLPRKAARAVDHLLTKDGMRNKLPQDDVGMTTQ